MLIARTVKHGREREFEGALHEFVEQSIQLPGQLGVSVMRPATGSRSREYGVLRRFANVEARDEFYRSSVYHDWKKRVAGLVEDEPRYEHFSGLETWFTLPGQRSIMPPPRWKMALVTLLAVYPVSVFLALTIGNQLADESVFVSSLVMGVLMVVLLTWVLMPLLSRLLENWLYPNSFQG